MRFLPALLLAVLLAPASLRAEGTAVPDVIRDQISAFQADDFATAFDYASPNIKRLFGTPERFGQMVQNGYPMVYRPAEVRMLELRDIGGAKVQRVMIRDAQGRFHLLDYQMIETENGWQINGVQLLQAAELGV
ncbi:DUF4864 domain-containing protein [Roseibaca sp. Y0-43]|uniref:DUF4864 domain-containing protein n=1 Tax=Roseibaca sp. Y0-43 TaxID=2816854 RepID=UPI001D0C4F11|nr:DUF4864 domain-containing protein [Roseibaca sp. Y0-43]MCC1480548.1 DUF4864 domain-containing protein [Roseibaca sp. Y0-43]